jgi:SAM-dependent methyltransferase
MLPSAYTWKVRALKTRRGSWLWRYWHAMRGRQVGSYSDLPDYIRCFAPGRTFVDIGCMWGVDGDHAFVAEEAGATAVTGVDVFGPTPEFEARRAQRGSRVQFVLGDATSPATIAAVGQADVVFCAGVLYHHPAPFDVLVALRRMCRGTLILRTSTIPEMPGVTNAAVYFPRLAAADRQLWNLASLGLATQVGITTAFQGEEGYGNWFWGLTPSCLVSMLETAGFRIQSRAIEPFAQTVVCTAVDAPFEHRLPGEAEARGMAAEISRAGIARPA